MNNESNVSNLDERRKQSDALNKLYADVGTAHDTGYEKAKRKYTPFLIASVLLNVVLAIGVIWR